MFTQSYSRNSFHFDTVSIPSSIRQLAETKPDSEAFVFLSNDGPREVITWYQFHATCVDYAKSLLTLGVQPGDIVAITASNSSRCLYAMFGSLFAGCIPFGITPMFQDGEDLVSIFKRLEKCSTYFVDPGDAWDVVKVLLTSYSKDGHAVSEKLPSLRHLILTSPLENETDILTMDDLLAIPTKVSELPEPDPDEIAVMFHTSGSTGSPKIAAHTHSSLSWSAQSYSATCFKPGERIYNDGLFRWAGGWPFNVVTGETRICISGSDRYGPAMARIQQERCTTIKGAPSLLKLTLGGAEKVGNNWHVTTVIASGLPVTEHLFSVLKPFCSRFINQFAASEAPMMLTNTVRTDDNFADYCCGGPAHGKEVKVVDDEGETVPVNTKGEICLKGPGMFAGYFNDPEQTKNAITEDGWYKTDDIGYMTEDGGVFVQGRKLESIRLGGLFVLPSEIESVLKTCPGIQDAIVVPIPDDTYFRLMCACVIRESGSEVNEDAVREHFGSICVGNVRMNRFLKSIMFYDSFPMTDTGKIRRKRLIEEAIFAQ